MQGPADLDTVRNTLVTVIIWMQICCFSVAVVQRPILYTLVQFNNSCYFSTGRDGQEIQELMGFTDLQIY